MKRIAVLLVFILSAFMSDAQLSTSPEKHAKLVYKGMTEEGYLFIDESGAEQFFEDAEVEVMDALIDDEEAYVNKPLQLTWVEDTYEEYDDEGEPMDETYTVKRITRMKKVQE